MTLRTAGSRFRSVALIFAFVEPLGAVAQDPDPIDRNPEVVTVVVVPVFWTAATGLRPFAARSTVSVWQSPASPMSRAAKSFRRISGPTCWSAAPKQCRRGATISPKDPRERRHEMADALCLRPAAAGAPQGRTTSGDRSVWSGWPQG